MCSIIKRKSRNNFKPVPSAEFARIFYDFPESYQKIVSALDELKIQHCDISFESSQLLKVVLFGLDRDTKTIIIEEALITLNYPPLKLTK